VNNYKGRTGISVVETFHTGVNIPLPRRQFESGIVRRIRRDAAVNHLRTRLDCTSERSRVYRAAATMKSSAPGEIVLPVDDNPKPDGGDQLSPHDDVRSSPQTDVIDVSR